MDYINCWCITEDMLRWHAEQYDNIVMGSIVLYALGIRASCTTFCLCKDPKYEYGKWFNLSWICDNGDEWMKTVSINAILDGLNQIKIVFRSRQS